MMMLAAGALLGALGAAASTRGSGPASTANAGEGSQGEFAEALAKAKSGTLASGAEVKIAKGLSLKLTESQMQRLSAAADRAEAQGAGRAIVLIDGQALKLDVGSRTITGAADMSSTQVMSDADTVISVASENAQAPMPLIGPPSASAAALANPSLLKSLSTPAAAVKPVSGQY